MFIFIYRDAVECLKNNFKNEEPILDFFCAGCYTADQRSQAEGEFIRAISILAKRVNDNHNNSNNVEKWAKDIMMNGFDSASSALVPSRKRLRSHSSSSLPRTKPKTEVEVREHDGIRITGLDVSFATYMKYKSIKLPPPANKRRHTLKDISDPNEGSHLNLLNEKQQEQVEELFTCELNYENLYSKQL
ncbi:hypothetical protein BDC45DRAFT_537588 [Circinella umbellata]|nr:hypothetical protein BDC45DRAFT_537588 [Circinella umbellata]